MTMAEIDKSKTREEYFRSAAPGVYFETEFRLPRRTAFTTGVPVFLGVLPSLTRPEFKHTPVMLTLWSQFEKQLCKPDDHCDLAYAVRGFFENGGRACYVVVLDRKTES